MNELASIAVEAINNYKNNDVIMNFVTTEALEKTAADIRAKTGSGTTAKAVEILSFTNKKVAARIEDYVNMGLIGCYMASLNK